MLSPGSFLIGKKKDMKPIMYRNEPPEFLLDFESSLAESQNYHSLPTALVNLIRSVKYENNNISNNCQNIKFEILSILFSSRVFGYLDEKIILEMCKYMETKVVYAGNYLFKIGDPDDSIYVVESGKIQVYITDEVKLN